MRFMGWKIQPLDWMLVLLPISHGLLLGLTSTLGITFWYVD